MNSETVSESRLTESKRKNLSQTLNDNHNPPSSFITPMYSSKKPVHHDHYISELTRHPLERTPNRHGVRETESSKEINDAVAAREKRVDDKSRKLKEFLSESKYTKLKEMIQEIEEIEEKGRKNNLRQAKLEERIREVEVKERAVDLREKEARMLLEKNDLKAKERRALFEMLNERAEKVVEREKEVEELIRSTKLKEKEVEEKIKELKLKEKEMRIREENDDLRRKELRAEIEMQDERAKQLKDIEEKVEECVRNAEVKEKEVAEKIRGFDLKEKEIHRREEIIDSSGKELCIARELQNESARQLKDREEKLAERIREVTVREKEVEENYRVVELREKEMCRREESLDSSRKELEAAIELQHESAKKLKTREENLEERIRNIEVREKEVEEQIRNVDLKKKELQRSEESVNSSRKELCAAREESDKQFKDREEKLEEKIRGIEMRVTEVELKEMEVKQWEESIDSSRRELFAAKESQNERAKQLQDREEKLEERIREVDARENEVHRCKKSTDSNRRELFVMSELRDKRLRQIDELERMFKLLWDNLERREKGIDEREQEIQLRVKEFESEKEQFEEKDRQLKLKERTIDELYVEIASREKQLELQVRDFELKEKQVQEVYKESPFRMVDDNVSGRSHVRVAMLINGKALQILLNERWKERDSLKNEVATLLRLSSDPAELVLDAMEGFYPPRLKKGDVEFKEDVVRQNCIMLLEQLMNISPVIKPHVREEAKKLVFAWVTKMKADAEHSIEVLGFLQLVACYGLASTFDENELVNYLKVVAKHSQARELSQALGLADKTSDVLFDSKDTSSLDFQPQMNNSTGEVDIQSLRLLLNKDENLDSLPGEVLNAIRLACDSAKLVLDIIRDALDSDLEVTAKFKLRVTGNSCVLLLEQLRKLSPQIKQELRDEALRFALSWMEKYRPSRKSSTMTRIFLELLAAYGIASFFNKDMLFHLIDGANYQTEVPDFYRFVGSLNLIPRFVRNLIKQDKILEAIRYICAADMVDQFPVKNLLHQHMSYCLKQGNEFLQSLEGKGLSRVYVEIQVMEKGIALARDVIQFVKCYNLESIFPPWVIEERIATLEKRIEMKKQENGCSAGSEPKSSKERNEKKREVPAASSIFCPSVPTGTNITYPATTSLVSCSSNSMVASVTSSSSKTAPSPVKIPQTPLLEQTHKRLRAAASLTTASISRSTVATEAFVSFPSTAYSGEILQDQSCNKKHRIVSSTESEMFLQEDPLTSHIPQIQPM